MGIWLLSQYLNSGAKHDIQLVELGPGRGTLMDDVLRVRYSFYMSVHFSNRSQTLSQFPHSRTSVKRVHLVESSLALRAVQEKKLQAWGGNGKSGLELHWHHSVEDIPTTDGVYTMLVAHEFFDALPFHLIEVRLRHLYRCQTHTLIEKSSRLERGLDYLCSRSSCKDYPETF